MRVNLEKMEVMWIGVQQWSAGRHCVKADTNIPDTRILPNQRTRTKPNKFSDETFETHHRVRRRLSPRAS